MAKIPASATTTAAKPTATPAAPGASVDETGTPISTVPDGHGDTVTLPDAELNTAADPKTANGDEARKEAGISASATAEQVLANGGKDTIDHTVKSTERPDVPAEPDAARVAASGKGKKVTGRVLTPITLAGQRFEPNDIIEGVPESLAGESIDTSDDAVAYCRAHGFPVKPFQAE
ncbi:MAG: hypothetical protein EOO22_05660 [Comamonadaceae bacterium]|nr:MAG: hypothetical protein EOO22_05660 [Comamonadaceae bacterium]